MIYTLAFLASFVFVGLKSFQQLNVQHDRYTWIVPTSMAMACCEVYVMWMAASKGWGWVVLPVGLGAGLGCMAGMYTHKRLRNGR